VTEVIAPATLRRFRELVADRLGLSFPETGSGLLVTALRRRAAHHQTSGGEYLDRFAAGLPWKELAAVAEDLTITETYFFRHAEQLQALSDEVLPQRLRARADERRLRLLSAACASGEEAYTLAILALEAVHDPSWDVSVVGVDANSTMLRKAVEARYSAWSLRGTPDRIQRDWFRRQDRDFRLDQRVRNRVSFLHHNLAADHPTLWRPGAYDVIFCRNLLMYLTSGAAADLVARMTDALAPGGYLFLGHTDSLGSRPPSLRLRHSHNAFYYQREPHEREPHEREPDRREPAVAAALPSPSSRSSSSAPPSAGLPVRGPIVRQPVRHSTQWRHALRLLHEERFLEALDVASAGAVTDPDLRLLRAVLLAHSGLTEQAAAAGRELLAADALNADAHHLLAMCHENRAEIAGAIEHYRLAAYLDPEFAMPGLRLGLLAARRGDIETTRLELGRALDLLRGETEDRLVFFGGGFGRRALIALCRTELETCGSRR